LRISRATILSGASQSQLAIRLSKRSISATLIAEGHAPGTPALVVSNATRKSQRHVLATLSTIARRAARLEAPAVLFVGPAVSVAARLVAATAHASSAPSAATFARRRRITSRSAATP